MKYIQALLFVAITSLFLTPAVFAQQTNSDNFMKARVRNVIKEGVKKSGQTENFYQVISLTILEGEEAEKQVTAEFGGLISIPEQQKLKPGDTVILNKTKINNKDIYVIHDLYRLNTIIGIFIAFLALVLIIAGRKGIGSIAGMLISILVIFVYIVPQILNGADPLLISITGALFIMITTIYLAHGFSQQTTVAVISTFLSLLVTIILSIVFVSIARLSGLGSEDMALLSQSTKGNINFQGLLLGGIIIGTLGVLDDITTTQTASVFALNEANSRLSFADLVRRGMKIGREHIASLVNTLILAYAGASIGIFIFLQLGMQQSIQPLWVMLNNELIIEEVIRSLAGSIGLISAVPISSCLAAFFTKYSLKIR